MIIEMDYLYYYYYYLNSDDKKNLTYQMIFHKHIKIKFSPYRNKKVSESIDKEYILNINNATPIFLTSES